MSLATAGPEVEAVHVRPRPRRRWPQIVCLLGALIAVVAVGRWVLDLTSAAPDAFPQSFGSASSSVAVPVGETYLAGGTADLPTVTVLDADPIVAADSAAVAASVVACIPQPGMGLLGAGVDDVGRWCDSRSVRGLDLSALPDGTYLMLVLVPLAEGPVDVTGVDIGYHDEHGDGAQRVEWDVSIPAR